MSDITFGTFDTTVVAIGARPHRRPEAAKALETAGFIYQPAVGFYELPTDTHPLDAMLRIEYAADLLAAAGFDSLGIDPDLTHVFERQVRQHAARTSTGHAIPPLGGTPTPTARDDLQGGPASPPTRTR